MRTSPDEGIARIEADTLYVKRLQKARYNNDITVLLRPWYTYRLYVRFLQPYFDKRSGAKLDSMHFFGHEHTCSYNQCRHGHVANIVLDKLKGYKECLDMAEQKFAGKYYHATLYARDVFPGGKFNIICRHYDGAKGLKEVADPLILPEHNQVLYHHKVMGDYMDVSADPY